MHIHTRPLLLASTLTLAGLAVLVTTPRPTSAWPSYLTTWQSTYPSSTTDDNVIAGYAQGCAVCHFSPSGGIGWNPYGWEIRQKLHGGIPIQSAILAAAFFDSDANPTSGSNSREVGGHTQPGWTPGPSNIRYDDMGATTGQIPPALIQGSLDLPSGPMVAACTPGAGGTMVCPCGNPPSGLNRGCNNSNSTTGAALHASGAASLATDTLVFTTGGEKQSALSILLQGTTALPGGVVYGQGVRCFGGTLKRLFNRQAFAGSITVPNLGAGDLPVSAASAAKGDTIAAGQSRSYLVYYRDPSVLGGCPTSSTFNATQAGDVSWAP